MKSESNSSLDDERFMSKSFGGGFAPIAKANLDRQRSSDLSQVKYSGYLLKRSNRPWNQNQNTQFAPIMLIDPLDDPGLPMMPGMFAPQNLEERWADSAVSQAITTNLPPIQTGLAMPSTRPSETAIAKSPLELGLESAAAFFGMSLGESETTFTQQSTQVSTRESEDLQIPAMLPPRKTSAPIKVGQGRPAKDRGPRHQPSFVYNRQHSAPDLLTPNSDSDDIGLDPSHSPLHDFTDADGHLWRSKYCVLEENILYFYRNPSDAQSAEAVQERRQAVNQEDNQVRRSSESYSSMDLSKSPMARNLLHHLDSGSGHSQGCIWEKRVFLNSVGSVRSAEQEYGVNSFQLEAINDEEKNEVLDTLVLRARNQDDMKEWIFQFHRSLSSFMRNILKAGIYLDIAHPALSFQPSSLMHGSPSEKQLQRLLAMSPKFSNTPPISNSLSHGHGRIKLHRRRQDVRKSTASEDGTSSLSSSPETNLSNSPQHQRAPSPNNNGFPMSPVEVRPPDRFLLPPIRQQANEIPELSAPRSNYPEMERPKPTTAGRYVPPHLRGGGQEQSEETVIKTKYIPPHLRKKQQGNDNSDTGSNDQKLAGSLLSLAQRAETAMPETQGSATTKEGSLDTGNGSREYLDVVDHQTTPFKRGGCADPQVVDGSIMDPVFIPRKASKLGPISTEPFGSFGGGNLEGESEQNSSLRWEIGAVSECGIRNSNEDAYLITNNLLDALQSLHAPPDAMDAAQPWNIDGVDHHVGLFAVFDGHCGDQAARFATEKLAHFMRDEITSRLKEKYPLQSLLAPSDVELLLHEAITKLDDTFCCLCQEGDREWESGATALVALIANENLVVANVGDCRGVLCRFVNKNTEAYFEDDVWNELDTVIDDSGRRSNGDINRESNCCFWREITDIHSPSVEQERNRIENANGWVTTETEIPIGQLRRMDFLDEDVIGILQRCLNDRNEDSEKSTKECKAAPQRILHISRVCGELAVSRALGDRDFKAAFNIPTDGNQSREDPNQCWECPLFLPYPEVHDRCFRGDLVSNRPDFQRIRVGEDGVSEEFVLLACDGLWDVLDADDAVRVTRDLLFRKNFTAKRAAARLAELAIHLGSSDNITVVVIRLFSK